MRLRLLFILLVASALIFAVACDDDDDSNNTNNNTNLCGNMVIDGTEVCDGTDLGNVLTCSDLDGFDGTEVPLCSALCDGFTTTMCLDSPVCGDGIKDEDEACDGTDLGLIQTCADLDDFDGTDIPTCDASCLFVTTMCQEIVVCDNDGIKDADEACDGTDFGTITGEATPITNCLEYDPALYSDGELSCVQCEVITTDCTPL
jgi:hypothetical protein